MRQPKYQPPSLAFKAAISFGAEAKIRQQFPDAQIMTVADANGRKRLTAVIPIG